MLEQFGILGEEAAPVLRKEFAAGRPSGVADGLTHASLVARRDAGAGEEPHPTAGPPPDRASITGATGSGAPILGAPARLPAG